MSTLSKTLLIAVVASVSSIHAAEPWSIDTQQQWENDVVVMTDLELKDGMAMPTAEVATFRSELTAYPEEESARTLRIEQSPFWLNWTPVSNVGPANLGDAPVTLALGPNNYWMFGRYGTARRKRGDQRKSAPFIPEPATLEGFDIELLTTPWPNQFDAPGGLKKSEGGYHAWQSRDMVNWVHHGPITEGFAKWMTTAEYVNGKAYFYYDFPNDQDPHLYVDSDLTDGEPGENVGLAFADPSHGSDCGVIRDLDGRFHLIAEDWSPIDAQSRSWDSPLAIRGVSKDGKAPFVIQNPPPVDHRTKPIGKTGTFRHPHWVKEDPENYKTNIVEYEIHEPEQPAYGDWAAIAIGGRYYLFGDYDPAGGHEMSVGRFTSPDIDTPFEWCGNIGKGHPDPDIMFAEGKFYLVTQQNTDFTSPGPWVGRVEARVGVDTDNDGKINRWTGWQELNETYDHMPGFAKQIRKTPAELDLSALPAGHAFRVEVKITDTTDNESKPILDKLILTFAD